MSSRDGLSWAKVDTGLLHDAKVVQLARLQRDEQRTAATVTLYLSAVLASWRSDEPISAAVAAPAWWLGDVAPIVADLVAVGLLDADGSVPAETLDRWMASTRAMAEAGRSTAARRWGAGKGRVRGVTGAHAEREIEREERERESERERDRGSARTADAADPRPFGVIMSEMGLDPAAVGKENT